MCVVPTVWDMMAWSAVGRMPAVLKAVASGRQLSYSFRKSLPLKSCANTNTSSFGLIWTHFRQNHTQAPFSVENSPQDGQLALSDAQRRTIYALSTPPGKAGVAVVRVSGPDVLEVWRRMVVRSPNRKGEKPTPWKMERCHIVDPMSGETIDDGLAVYFAAPRSFTTEEVLELHTHSGRALIAAMLRALSRIPSLRPAEPGEFTRRAFAGGRLDLTQVEGLRDLIDAETEGQRRMALRAAEVWGLGPCAPKI